MNTHVIVTPLQPPRGEFLRDAMRRERVTEGEVLAAVREQGTTAVEHVEAVVLETAGTISVLRKSDVTPSSLRQVRGMPDEAGRSS